VRPKPIPPADLTEEQTADWLRLANRIPDDLPVDDVAPLLTELARHMSFARQLAEELAKLRQASLKPARVRGQFADLLKLHERQSMRIAALTTKLRLAPQVREAWQPRHRLKPVNEAPKPWQLEALDLEPVEALAATSEGKN
jgi:hypothetical protein